MSDDDNSELEELKIDRQLRERNRAVASGGARIHQDGRVSKVMGWVWTVIGAGFIGAVMLVANNLWQLNLAINRLADNGEMFSKQLDDHENRLRRVEKDVSAIEGKVFRGLAGYGDEKEEPSRGH